MKECHSGPRGWASVRERKNPGGEFTAWAQSRAHVGTGAAESAGAQCEEHTAVSKRQSEGCGLEEGDCSSPAPGDPSAEGEGGPEQLLPDRCPSLPS